VVNKDLQEYEVILKQLPRNHTILIEYRFIVVNIGKKITCVSYSYPIFANSFQKIPMLVASVSVILILTG